MWGRGGVRIGSVTYESAGYCAVYTTKKVGGDLAKERYSRVDLSTGETWMVKPEFAKMSLKPGIGLEWLKLYWKDIFVSGANGVVINGSVKRTPRYFHDKMDDIAKHMMDDYEYQQYLKVDKENSTRERLEIRESVAKAKERFNSERKGIHHAL